MKQTARVHEMFKCGYDAMRLHKCVVPQTVDAHEQLGKAAWSIVTLLLSRNAESHATYDN